MIKLLTVTILITFPAMAIETDLQVTFDSQKGTNVQFKAQGSVIQTLKRAANRGQSTNIRVLPSTKTSSQPTNLTDPNTFFQGVGKQ